MLWFTCICMKEEWTVPIKTWKCQMLIYLDYWIQEVIISCLANWVFKILQFSRVAPKNNYQYLFYFFQTCKNRDFWVRKIFVKLEQHATESGIKHKKVPDLLKILLDSWDWLSRMREENYIKCVNDLRTPSSSKDEIQILDHVPDV